MKLEEARKICEQWFAHNERARQKSLDMQKIAADVRHGVITSDEARRKVRNLDGLAPVVYSGERLEEAVKFLIKENAALTKRISDAGWQLSYWRETHG